MKIQSGSTANYIYFVAVDATDLKTRETGLSSFTVYRSRNGGADSAMTTPTVTEIDATNMPGLYGLLLDEDTTATEAFEEIAFHITHAGMAPVTRSVEIHRISDSNTVQISSDATAADNLESDYDGTGYNKSNSTIGTTTTNTDMRGTNSANTTAPPTVSAIRSEIDSNSTQLAAIVADTNELQTDDVPGLISALDTKIGTPSDTSISQDIANDSAILDTLATSSALATVDSNVDAILVDTGTTIPAQITALNDVSVSGILTTQMTESYASDGTAPTLAQALFNLQQTLGDFSITGTTITVKKLDGSTTAMTYTLDDATTPTSRTRAT